jgi:dTDP-4-dehydrorhamnose 3,5-epimerase/CDP-3, 6-dideoxy-D-glycero-D-glycero-4-hexulose-5-epimerase
MKILLEPMDGLLICEPNVFSDERGEFTKILAPDIIGRIGAGFSVAEEFYTNSRKNVIRGMHFQVPPKAHNKLVYCVKGKVLDVVVDLRKSSGTYLKAVGQELSAQNRLVMYIPKGFAHGFLSLEDDSCMVYKTDVPYSPSEDKGIHWRSIDFNWPSTDGPPILSARDSEHPPITGFDSPF